MNAFFKRCAGIAATGALCAALSGCLITNFASNTSGGLTTATATVTLTREAPCTVDAVAVTTNCRPVMQVGQPPLGQSYQFDITLLNYAQPLTLYDPVILQVPKTMSDFAGSIAAGPPGVTPGTPLLVQSGLSTIPIDANTNLIAEPGMQLVIIDFVAPANTPFGQYTLNLQFRGTASSIKVIFAGKITAGGTTYYPPIYPCVTSMSQVPSVPIPTSLAQLLTIVLNAQGCVGKQYSIVAKAQGNVVEYYNQALDHYFISWIPAEIANLDAGNTPTKWIRTGVTLNLDTSSIAGLSPVCRYYIPPVLGDSHFFGRGTAECNATGANNPTFVLEDPAFMFVALPAAGVCPAGTVNVYRVFSNRPDANHRYMTDPAIRAQMVAAGWLAEGDGADLVVMCAKP